jgi:hypothetical protein
MMSFETTKTTKMSWTLLLKSVNNKTIQFATYRPSGTKTALLERKIKVTGPDSVLTLMLQADVDLLPALIDLLKDSTKAFAAEIILTALTDANGKTIEAFSGNPEEWWKTLGVNAYQHWNNWYEKTKKSIEWDKSKKIFVMIHVKN